EYQPCNTNACPELKKTTPWTPWTPVNISDNGGHYEQRFRYTCKARLPDPNLLEVGRQRIEMRYCSSDGTSGCSTDGLSGDFLRAGRYSAHTVNGAWSAWTSWSQCSRDCSRGIRNRKRVCNNPEPNGWCVVVLVILVKMFSNLRGWTLHENPLVYESSPSKCLWQDPAVSKRKDVE
ncbi:hypothetical protein A6R68_07704, partial [Neotoma lepida]